jgi:hypothetical protein
MLGLREKAHTVRFAFAFVTAAVITPLFMPLLRFFF